MDYADDVKYPVTCKKAVEKGIIINTIQCGNSAECTKFWKDIATKAEGSFAAIPQAGGVVAVATPFDGRLAELNTELLKTAVVYGGRAYRADAERRVKEADKLDAPAAAERAGFSGKSSKVVEGDLLEDIKTKKVELKDLKKEEMPEELKKCKTDEERKEYLAKVEKKRTELNKEVIELDRKRADFIAKELEKKGKGKDSFDSQVLEMLRNQAKKYDVKY
jgi:hypothetical protein